MELPGRRIEYRLSGFRIPYRGSGSLCRAHVQQSITNTRIYRIFLAHPVQNHLFCCFVVCWTRIPSEEIARPLFIPDRMFHLHLPSPESNIAERTATPFDFTPLGMNHEKNAVSCSGTVVASAGDSAGDVPYGDCAYVDGVHSRCDSERRREKSVFAQRRRQLDCPF